MKRIKYKNYSKNKITTLTIISILIWTFVIYMYNTYNNIELEYNDYETEKLEYINSEKNIEKAKKNNNIEDIIEETTKSIVGISKLKNTGNLILTNNDESKLGIGTGVLVTDNGYILSNEHVTGNKYSTCYITLENGNRHEGKVVWSDKSLDLSLTKIDIKNKNYAKLGNSNEIKIGQTVYAIGNPIGFEFRQTVTSGIISAKNRTIKIENEKDKTYMSDLIQTDATINPGNSGGPLILSNGEVIGINTVKISSAEGIGFAVPINVVKSIIKSYEETNDYEQPTMGIYAIDTEVAKYLNQNINIQNGIYVEKIERNGPAYKTDLKEKDIIRTIDGNSIFTINELKEYVYKKKPGEEIVLKINRGKINKEIKLKLDKK